MNRRLFLGSIVPLTAVLPSLHSIIRAPHLAIAQEETPPFEYNFVGGELSAVQIWQARYSRLKGAITLSTGFDVFEDETLAKTAFKKFGQYLDDYYEYWADAEFFVELDRESAKPPKLGSRRSAWVSTVEILGYDVEAMVTAMFAVEGAMLHKWLAVGLSDTTEELFDLAEDAMGFADVDRNWEDDELLALLPSAAHVPRALDLTSEYVERY